MHLFILPLLLIPDSYHFTALSHNIIKYHKIRYPFLLLLFFIIATSYSSHTYLNYFIALPSIVFHHSLMASLLLFHFIIIFFISLIIFTTTTITTVAAAKTEKNLQAFISPQSAVMTNSNSFNFYLMDLFATYLDFKSDY